MGLMSSLSLSHLPVVVSDQGKKDKNAAKAIQDFVAKNTAYHKSVLPFFFAQEGKGAHSPSCINRNNV